MKELHIRAIYGLLFATVLAGAIILGPISFAILFLILATMALHEFYALCRVAGFSPQVYPGIIFGALLFSCSYLTVQQIIPVKSFQYLLPLSYLFLVCELYRKKEAPLVNLALTVFGIVYVAIPFSLLNILAFHPIDGVVSYHYELLMSLFIFVWMSDTGAYILGVRFGRHRLFERISPKKSWEGLVGGVASALFSAWILSLIFTQYSFLLMGIMALVVAISGTLGDLIESMIKRSVGLKDSGQFMPGHGGVLDRFDSILLASPVIYFVFQFLH